MAVDLIARKRHLRAAELVDKDNSPSSALIVETVWFVVGEHEICIEKETDELAVIELNGARVLNGIGQCEYEGWCSQVNGECCGCWDICNIGKA